MRRLALLPLLLLLTLGACGGPPAPRNGMLFSFEDEAELDRLIWGCHELMTISPLHATAGRHSLEFEAYPAPYPGLMPRLPFEDWSSFHLLRFEVFNEQDTALPITVRVDDRDGSPPYDERYNHQLELKPGPNSVAIPLAQLRTSGGGRPLQLDSIKALIIFVPNPKQRTVLYFDAIRLE